MQTFTPDPNVIAGPTSSSPTNAGQTPTYSSPNATHPPLPTSQTSTGRVNAEVPKT
jgi:hypothetical protein